jgi:uncharacterized cupredoxin-like copper-binding protein
MAQRSPRRTRSAAAVAAAIAIAAAGLSACGSTAKKPASTVASAGASTTTAAAPAAKGAAKVAVTLSEFKIKPAVASVPAGRVTFVVTNAGKVKHQFTIIRTDKPAAAVLSKHNPDDDIAGARGEISSLVPGTTKTLVVKDLKPGHYALVCALPGHYQAGMYADFTVKA